MCISVNVISMKSQALEHSLQWSAATRGEHVDNVFLSSARKEYLASAVLSPTLTYDITSPNWSAQLNTAANYRQTSDESFDTNDYSYNANFMRRGEYTSVSGRISRLDATVREIDIAESNRITNDPVVTDSASADWQHQITSYDQISIGAQYLSRDYSSQNYSDYEDWRLTGLWQHSFTEQFATQAQLYYGEYDSERVNLDQSNIPPVMIKADNGSETAGAQMGFFGKLNHHISYNLLAGASKIRAYQSVNYFLRDEDQVPYFHSRVSDENYNNIFAGTLTYVGERSQINLRADKQLRASGNGFQFDTRQLQFGGSYRLTQFWSLNGTLTYGEQEAVESGVATNERFNRHFNQADLSLSKRFSEHWTASVSTYYNSQKYEINPDTAEAVTGIVQLRYSPDKLAW